MVRKLHARQEILSSNPDQPFLTKIGTKESLRYRYFILLDFLPVAADRDFSSRFPGTALEPVPKPLVTRYQKAFFLVVY